MTKKKNNDQENVQEVLCECVKKLSLSQVLYGKQEVPNSRQMLVFFYPFFEVHQNPFLFQAATTSIFITNL